MIITMSICQSFIHYFDLPRQRSRNILKNEKSDLLSIRSLNVCDYRSSSRNFALKRRSMKIHWTLLNESNFINPLSTIHMRNKLNHHLDLRVSFFVLLSYCESSFIFQIVFGSNQSFRESNPLVSFPFSFVSSRSMSLLHFPFALIPPSPNPMSYLSYVV